MNCFFSTIWTEVHKHTCFGKGAMLTNKYGAVENKYVVSRLQQMYYIARVIT